MRVLVQHPHRDGEISGVLNFVRALTDYAAALGNFVRRV